MRGHAQGIGEQLDDACSSFCIPTSKAHSFAHYAIIYAFSPGKFATCGAICYFLRHMHFTPHAGDMDTQETFISAVPPQEVLWANLTGKRMVQFKITSTTLSIFPSAAMAQTLAQENIFSGLGKAT